MRCYYITAEGHAYAEFLHPKFRAVEFRDGYHPVVNTGIWRSGDRDEEACIFVWQGRSSPEGQDASQVRFFMKKCNRLKDNRQAILVSTIWWRYAKNAGAIIIASVILYAIARVGWTIYLASQVS